MDVSPTNEPADDPERSQEDEPGTSGPRAITNGIMEDDSPTADGEVLNGASNLFSMVLRHNNDDNNDSNDRPTSSSPSHNNAVVSAETISDETIPVVLVPVDDDSEIDTGTATHMQYPPRQRYRVLPNWHRISIPIPTQVRCWLIERGLLFHTVEFLIPRPLDIPETARPVRQYHVDDIPGFALGEYHGVQEFIIVHPVLQQPVGPPDSDHASDRSQDVPRTPEHAPETVPLPHRGMPPLPPVSRHRVNSWRRRQFWINRLSYEVLQGAVGITWPSPIVMEVLRRSLRLQLRVQAHLETDTESESETEPDEDDR